MSPEEMQKYMEKWRDWYEDLEKQGKAKGGHPLDDGGTTVSAEGASDGPFAESKEAVSGYFIIEAASFEGATEIAKGCPGLEFGAQVEVRKIASCC